MMSYNDLLDVDSIGDDDRQYSSARRMGDYLRSRAQLAIAIARGTAALWALVAAYLIYDMGGVVGPAFCLVLAVLAWVSANPWAIVLRGLADLTDAIADIAINTPPPVSADASDPASSTVEDRRGLAKRLAAEAKAKRTKG